MIQKTYRIGDVANLMGLSRDTLRYYEKRGILDSRKSENGYRYYTGSDISRLLTILYQRKMDIGLNDIESIWFGEETLSPLSRIIASRLEEERTAIRRHQQTIARLNLTGRDCSNIQLHLNQVLLSETPKNHIIVPHTDISGSLALWFQYAQKYPGLDMMYIYDSYSWKQDGDSFQLTYHDSSLTLREELAPYVDYDLSEEAHPLVQPTQCVTTYLLSDHRKITGEDIRPMISWAESQGLMISGQVYVTFMLQSLNQGKQSFYLQLFIPVF
ncbi:MAG: MerR family transcriptional regulator [Eubacteriales bacterium]|nr:MerR family transcriptional regulator [Eubacteriales bacterium]